MKQLEQKLNRLYDKIKVLKLSQDELNRIGITHFLYSCSRMNILQVVAILTAIAKKHHIHEDKIRELLE